MSPAQVDLSSSSKPSRPLAPAAVRTALENLRVAVGPDELKRAIANVLSSVHLHPSLAKESPSPKLHDEHEKATLNYVVTRLANGMSVSLGFTRANFTLAMYSVLKVHPNLDNAVSDVLHIYSSPVDPSEGSSALREHVLGALCSATAIVSAVGERLSLNASRDIIKLVRVAVHPDHAQWNLGSAAVAVIIRLLQAQPITMRPQLVKPLWAICTARPHADYALALALSLLLDFSLVTTAAISTLYPSLEGPFTDALFSHFETGFAALDYPALPLLLEKGPVLSLSDHDVVPLSWHLAVRFVAKGPEMNMDNNLCSFWENLVISRLLGSKTKSKFHKPLVAVQLLPIVIFNLNSASDIPRIIDEKFSEIVLTLLANSRSAAKSKRRHISIPHDVVVSSVVDALCRIPRDLAQRPYSETASTDASADAFILNFWMSVANNGLASAFGRPKNILERLNSLSSKVVGRLICSSVEAFAHISPESKKASRHVIEKRRIHISEFLLALAQIHSFGADDVVRILTLYSIFNPCPASKSAVQQPTDSSGLFFDVYKSKDRAFAHVLSNPTPAVSISCAAAVYKRIMDFLTAKGPDLHYALTCFRTLCAALNEPQLLQLKCSEHECLKPIQARLTSIVESPAKHDDNEESAMIESVKFLAVSLCCEMFVPGNCTADGLNDTTDISDVHTKEYERICHRLSLCFDHITGKSVDVSEDDPESDAGSIERVSHLICDFCGREKPRLYQAGLHAMELLRNFVDDRVVAVVFDVLETYHEGVDLADIVGIEDVENASSNESEDAISEGSEVDSDMERELPLERKGVAQMDIDDGKNSDGEDPDEIIEPDIDVDAEDETVLEALDKHLAQHMRLINLEKKNQRQHKESQKVGFWRVTKVLKLIEHITRILRIRVENAKHDAQESRTALVFLDTIVRLFEFSLINGSEPELLTQTCAVFLKQARSVPPSVLASLTTDHQSVLEIADRLFQAVINCKAERDLSLSNAQALSGTFGLLMSAGTLSSENIAISYFVPKFENLANLMLRNGNHVCCSELFASFLKRSGSEGLKLVNKIIDQLKDDNELSKKGRSKGAELIGLMVSILENNRDSVFSEIDIKQFWIKLEQCVTTSLRPGFFRQNWNRLGVKHLIHAVGKGLNVAMNPVTGSGKGSYFEKEEELREQILAVLTEMKLGGTDGFESLAKMFGTSHTYKWDRKLKRKNSHKRQKTR